MVVIFDLYTNVFLSEKEQLPFWFLSINDIFSLFFNDVFCIPFFDASSLITSIVIGVYVLILNGIR